MLGTKVLNYNIHGYRYPLFLSAFSTSWSMFEKGFLQNGTVYFPTASFLFVRKKLVNKTRVCKNRHKTDAEAS